MKFVILTQYYPPEIGAAQVRLSNFARQLRRAGHQVAVVTAMPNYPTGRIHQGYRWRLCLIEERDSIQVIRTAIYPSQSARFLPRLASYFSFMISAGLAVPSLGRPDYIFVESPPLFLGLAGHLLARLTGARWIMNVSDLWPDTVVELGMIGNGFALRLAYRLEHWLYGRASFVAAVTEGIRDRLQGAKQVPDARVLFLPNGVDTEMFQPRPPDRSLLACHGLEGKAVFIFAGLHGHAQDLPNILRAAEEIRHRPDIAFVFVGDGPVKQEAQATTSSRQLENVRFIDPQPIEAMPAWWSVARGALVTLRDLPLFEGARPSKAFPPLASGVPIVYAGRGELAATLTDAGCGIVVPPGDPRALATAIIRLADNPGEADRLGRAARQCALTQFAWNAIVDQWLAELAAKDCQ